MHRIFNIFTQNLFMDINWNNICIVGDNLICLDTQINNNYANYKNKNGFDSTIALCIFGLTDEQFLNKIKYILQILNENNIFNSNQEYLSDDAYLIIAGTNGYKNIKIDLTNYKDLDSVKQYYHICCDGTKLELSESYIKSKETKIINYNKNYKNILSVSHILDQRYTIAFPNLNESKINYNLIYSGIKYFRKDNLSGIFVTSYFRNNEEYIKRWNMVKKSNMKFIKDDENNIDDVTGMNLVKKVNNINELKIMSDYSNTEILDELYVDNDKDILGRNDIILNILFHNTEELTDPFYYELMTYYNLLNTKSNVKSNVKSDIELFKFLEISLNMNYIDQFKYLFKFINQDINHDININYLIGKCFELERYEILDFILSNKVNRQSVYDNNINNISKSLKYIKKFSRYIENDLFECVIKNYLNNVNSDIKSQRSIINYIYDNKKNINIPINLISNSFDVWLISKFRNDILNVGQFSEINDFLCLFNNKDKNPIIKIELECKLNNITNRQITHDKINKIIQLLNLSQEQLYKIRFLSMLTDITLSNPDKYVIKYNNLFNNVNSFENNIFIYPEHSKLTPLHMCIILDNSELLLKILEIGINNDVTKLITWNTFYGTILDLVGKFKSWKCLELMINIIKNSELFDHNLLNNLKIFTLLLENEKIEMLDDLVKIYDIQKLNLDFNSIITKPKSLLYLIHKFNYEKFMDEFNNNILHILCKNYKDDNNSLTCARIILKYDNTLVKKINNFGDAPIHVCSSPIMAQLLLENDADQHVYNHQGFAPIHLVSKKEMLDILIINDKNIIDYPTKYNNVTPIMLNIKRQNFIAVSELLNQGCNINIHDIFGNTIYHYLGQIYNNDILNLFDIGLYQNKENSFGISPSDYVIDKSSLYKTSELEMLKKKFFTPRIKYDKELCIKNIKEIVSHLLNNIPAENIIQ